MIQMIPRYYDVSQWSFSSTSWPCGENLLELSFVRTLHIFELHVWIVKMPHLCQLSLSQA
jgi:hypothetical protein